jgi:serine/threonine-protein kinase
MARTADGKAPVVLRDKYELQRELGAGGMGTVYLARHLLLQQPVAVKVLNPAAVDTPVAIERFLREARALAAVRHPAVCQVFDVDTNADGLPFIVMEYLEGKTLDQVMRAEPETSFSERVRWIIEAAEGLAAAHAQGIVHRDVKPANLILAGPKPGVVKVLDFGVAKRKEDQGAQLTGDAAVGTVKYMSPEQLLGEGVDARSDVWSLAVTLYQLLARKFPFDAETIGQYVHAVISTPPHPLAERGVDVPAPLWEALDHALKPIEQRTPNMKRFIADLRAAMKDLPVERSMAETRIAMVASALKTDEVPAAKAPRKSAQTRVSPAPEATRAARPALMAARDPAPKSNTRWWVGGVLGFVALVAVAVVGLMQGAPSLPQQPPPPVPLVEKTEPVVEVKPEPIAAPLTESVVVKTEPEAALTPKPPPVVTKLPKTRPVTPKPTPTPEAGNPDHL